jgi:hypothetical protein
VSDPVLRYAEGRDDARAIFRLLIEMHEEMGQAPLDAGKAFERVVAVVENGGAFMVEQDGELTATAGIDLFEYWYSQDTFIGDVWFYVAQDHRDGRAYELMLREAARVSETVGAKLVLIQNNPRRHRIPRTAHAIIASTIGYTPHGHVIATGEGEDVLRLQQD